MVQVCRNLVNAWRLAFYYFSKNSMAISPTTKLSSYTITMRLCYPVKYGSQSAFPRSNTGVAGSNSWQTPWCMDVFLYVVLACGDWSLGLGRFSLPKAASRTCCFAIMNKARLQILTKKKDGVNVFPPVQSSPLIEERRTVDTRFSGLSRKHRASIRWYCICRWANYNSKNPGLFVQYYYWSYSHGILYSMEQRPFWKASSNHHCWRRAPLWNSSIHYSVHNSQILRQINPVFTLIAQFPKIHFIIILPSTPISPKWALPLTFCN